MNWIKVLEDYFTWRQLRGDSCKDYAKRKLQGDARAWWKEVEWQLYQYSPTWNEMKLLQEDTYLHGLDPFSPPVEANLKPVCQFAQYLSLTQGKLSVEQYANEFERLQYLCDLGKVSQRFATEHIKKYEERMQRYARGILGSDPCRTFDKVPSPPKR